MLENWTFGRKVGVGFAAVVALAIAVGGLGVYALGAVVAAKDRVLDQNAANLVDAERLRGAIERKGGSARGFMLTGEERFVGDMRAARVDFVAAIERLRRRAAGGEDVRLINEIERIEGEHQSAVDHVLTLRRAGSSTEVVSRAFDTEVLPKRDALDRDIGSFAEIEQRGLDDGKRAASQTASTASTSVLAVLLLAVLLGIGIAASLSRALSSQIGTAVRNVQSSSAELQAASNQQATSAREQATGMNEITTTISELLATSRQIADSAQRVAMIAAQTATAARSGETTVDAGRDSISAIRRQVDVIVGHMLDLGRKSQQVGAVLEIVAELAEQTNILAINATIEAAGAGEAGRRFAVVADEIRKLADRVAGSTKEIRGLIDDVRSAVNTSVMTTESGSKAVDAGAKQFGDVAASFKQISSLVAATTEAAKEIELSTKQQTTAVEQVNIGTTNIAQAAKETEVSTTQTLQTASQLATLSRDLLRIVQAGPSSSPAHDAT